VHVDGDAAQTDGEKIGEKVKDSLTPIASDFFEYLHLQGGY
jgi:hypothetical protein